MYYWGEEDEGKDEGEDGEDDGVGVEGEDDVGVDGVSKSRNASVRVISGVDIFLIFLIFPIFCSFLSYTIRVYIISQK